MYNFEKLLKKWYLPVLITFYSKMNRKQISMFNSEVKLTLNKTSTYDNACLRARVQ